jgi:hypothetical protein
MATNEQNYIKQGDHTMANRIKQRNHPLATGRDSGQDVLFGLRATHTGLKKGLKSLRAVLSSAKREASAWHALDAEYGPNEPITSGFMPDVESVRMQQHLDRYRRQS